MTVVSPPHVARSIRVARTSPGHIERTLVVATVFINHFGTPENWLVVSTGSSSGAASQPILVFGTLLLVATLLFGLVNNGEAIYRVLATEPLLPFLWFLIVLSPLWSASFAASVNAVVNVLLLVMFAVVLLVRFRLHEIIALSALAMGIGVILDLIWVAAMGSLGSKGGVWDGLGAQKNDLGGHALVAAFVLICAARVLPRWRIFYYVLAAGAVVLMVGSQSKTALAAGALTAVCGVVFMAFRSRKTLYGAVIVSVGVASIMAILFVTSNLVLITDWLERDVTLTGRTELWSLVADAIAARPMLGYGYEGFFQGPLSSAHPIAAQADWAPTHAHNAYLQMALDVGLVGACVYAATVVRSLVRATTCARDIRGPLGLFPLVYITMATMISFTESGVYTQRFGLTLFVVSVVTAKTLVDTNPSAAQVVEHG